MSITQAICWQKAFSEDRTVVEDEQDSDQPSATCNDFNIAKVTR